MSNDLEYYRGDDHSFIMTITDSSGTAIDITGYTFTYTVKNIKDNVIDDSTAIIQKSVTSHTDPTAGITSIALTPTETNVTPGVYYHDFQMKDTSGDIFTFAEGKTRIKADVTRSTS